MTAKIQCWTRALLHQNLPLQPKPKLWRSTDGTYAMAHNWYRYRLVAVAWVKLQLFVAFNRD
jgi:hypothetical protein